MRTGTLVLRIDSQFDHVFLVGLSVRAICAAIPLDAEDAAAVELSVVEAVNNVIEHAYHGNAGHTVEIALALTADALDIEVRDHGRAMDWPHACARADTYAADELAEGGRGLFIMRSVMDAVSYVSSNGCNVLTLRKRLPSPTPPAREMRRSP